MTVTYKTVKEVHTTDNCTRVSYGIAAYGDDNILKYIVDISYDK